MHQHLHTAPSLGQRSSPGRVLLVCDDPSLALRLDTALRLHHLALDPTPLTGGAAAPLRANGCDVAVIDLRNQPERGVSALESLRHHAANLPLLVLVGRAHDPATLAALKAGADDFCVDSTDAQELAVRILALEIRRSNPRDPCRLVVGELELDPVGRTFRRCGGIVELSTRQFELLHLLMRHAGEVLTREQIESELSFRSGDRGSNVVEVHIHNLRRKIGSEHLSTIRGQGYVLHPGR
jgi:DNA-binding response OmpR family regulator